MCSGRKHGGSRTGLCLYLLKLRRAVSHGTELGRIFNRRTGKQAALTTSLIPPSAGTMVIASQSSAFLSLTVRSRSLFYFDMRFGLDRRLARRRAPGRRRLQRRCRWPDCQTRCLVFLSIVADTPCRSQHSAGDIFLASLATSPLPSPVTAGRPWLLQVPCGTACLPVPIKHFCLRPRI